MDWLQAKNCPIFFGKGNVPVLEHFMFMQCFNCCRSNIEENYSKLLSKLAKQASSCGANGTFAPLWQVLKTSSEKLATLHMQMVQKVSELVKDVNKYADELHKKHKGVRVSNLLKGSKLSKLISFQGKGR